MHYVLFALAILVVALMRLVPHAARFRIRVLRWIGWNWAVNVLEKSFRWLGGVWSACHRRDGDSAILCRMDITSRVT